MLLYLCSHQRIFLLNLWLYQAYVLMLPVKALLTSAYIYYMLVHIVYRGASKFIVLYYFLLKSYWTSVNKSFSSPGLEILARLCQVEENEELLAENLPAKLYSDIIAYLTVHDIQLIVYTLECLYQLSELGEEASTHIAAVLHAVCK